MATKKDDVNDGMFAAQPSATTTTDAQSAMPSANQQKKSTAPAIPISLQCLAPYLTKPKQAFMAAGGTEQQFAREINFAMQAMLNNQYLLQCAKSDPEYLVEAVKNVGLTGLSLNPELRLGYLVPFKGKIKFMASYMGKVDILIRTGVVKSIQAELVYENDEFKYEKGIKPVLKHVPDVFSTDRGKLKGGYYIAILANGEKIFDVMPEKRIQEIKRRSESVKSGKSSPWDTDFEEMAKKGLALDTLIPTPDGFTTMGELKVGDIVYNALGEETKVIAKSEVKHLPCYEVEFQNGDTVICDHEHRWFVKGSTNKEEWSVLETKDLYGVKELGYPIVIPHTKPVKMREQELEIDPYMLGYWLGNGTRKAAQVTCLTEDTPEVAAMFEKEFDTNIRPNGDTNSMTIGIVSKTGLRTDNSTFLQRLKKIGVYGNKHIPEKYKRASIEQRIELIRGLCDSDGSAERNRGRAIFGSVRQELAEDVYEILSSLGERVSMHSRVARGFGGTTIYYEMSWLPMTFNPFHLKRKAERIKERSFITNNAIKSIRKIESVPTQCIAVDSGDAVNENDLRKSYLIGYGFNPTHNTVINWAFKFLPKTGISDDMLKTIEAEGDFEREDFEEWRKSQEQTQKDPFKDDGKFTDFEEVKDETNS